MGDYENATNQLSRVLTTKYREVNKAYEDMQNSETLTMNRVKQIYTQLSSLDAQIQGDLMQTTGFHSKKMIEVASNNEDLFASADLLSDIAGSAVLVLQFAENGGDTETLRGNIQALIAYKSYSGGDVYQRYYEHRETFVQSVISALRTETQDASYLNVFVGEMNAFFQLQVPQFPDPRGKQMAREVATNEAQTIYQGLSEYINLDSIHFEDVLTSELDHFANFSDTYANPTQYIVGTADTNTLAARVILLAKNDMLGEYGYNAGIKMAISILTRNATANPNSITSQASIRSQYQQLTQRESYKEI